MSDRPELLRRLEAQVSARPGDPVGHAELAAALVGRPEATAARAKARELIVGCLHLGLHEPALAAAEALHRAFGSVDDAVLFAEVSAARRHAGDLDRARRLVEAVVESEPDALPARLRAAAFALGAGEPLVARRWIEPVAHQTAETSALYVQTLLVSGDAGALAEARIGVERHPGSAELWEMFGAAALERGLADLAIDAFSEVLRLAAERPQAYYNLALAFARARSLPAALGVVDAGLEARPGNARLVELREALRRELL